MALRLEDVHHRYGAAEVLAGIDLHVEHGEIVCLLGPSGCGKTTLLRLAAGLETLQRGRVAVEGRVVADAGHSVPPEQRGVGMLFQDFALFPHLSVQDNVAFGLRGQPAEQKRERVAAVLHQVGMGGFAAAYPHTLSGGQQQRVALARALAPRPRVVLLDEPFSDLDSSLRNRVRDDTLHALQESGAAALMVTHDPEEAMFMADRLAVMNLGRVLQIGTPAELYLKPASAFVAAFLGEVNRLAGVVREGAVATVLGPLPAQGLAEDQPVEVLIRPEALAIGPLGDDAGGPGTARVEAARMLGRTSLVHLQVQAPDGGEVHLHARIRSEVLPPRDAVVSVALDRARTYIFAADSAAEGG